jgi:cytochrome P450
MVQRACGYRDISDRLAREVLMLMFAGTDTTSYVISRCMIFLAKHPQWLTAIAEEQKRLIAEHGAAMDRTVCMPICFPHFLRCFFQFFS